MQKNLEIALIALVFLVVFSGVRVVQEISVGEGPRTPLADVQGPSREIAMIANGVGGTVTFVDLEALQTIGELDIIPDGKRVGFFRDPVQSLFWQPLIESRAGINYAQDTDLSPDGTVLYVARGHIGDVAAFDILSGSLLWRVPVPGARSDHMTLSKDGLRLFVSALSEEKVIVIDTALAKVTGEIPTGAWPHDNHVSADGQYLFNASIGNMTVDLEDRASVDQASRKKSYAYQLTKADSETFAVLDRYRFNAGIRPFALTPDADTVFAQLSNTHAIVEYSLSSRTVVRRIDLPVDDGVTEDDWDFEAPHHGLAMSPDERVLCVAGRASDYAALVLADGLGLEAIIEVGDAPSWAAIDEAGELCVLPNTRSDDVSIVSLSQQKELARLPTGDYPKHITIGHIPESVLANFKPRFEK